MKLTTKNLKTILELLEDYEELVTTSAIARSIANANQEYRRKLARAIEALRNS